MCWRYQNAQFQENEQKKVDERYYERLIWKRAIDRTIIVRIQNNKVLCFISMIQVCNKSPEIVPQNISKVIKLLHYDNTTLETFTHAVSCFKL